ncbi:MAG: LptF/LptG family permease, partial [Gammaproteobacteria bacterium]|nr:LptF/LptG family permease [Gammaproteobacteria bacterium]
MKIINRYVFGEFLKPFAWCTILFLFLYYIIDLFENLDEIIKAKMPLYILADYYFSLSPFIFVKICPIIILLATIYTLSNLNRNNEIMAIKAIGINLWSIIWIFLTFGVILSSICFSINELVVPDSYTHALNIK